jgi:hypothetical protein
VAVVGLGYPLTLSIGWADQCGPGKPSLFFPSSFLFRFISFTSFATARAV